ncbi:PAS domain-containing protein [Hymenobacter wooponensis]|uniref:histidine kinase n=2 Tax=Hymenobacter wooponensis TaxID=1525360 RepID=A0A4Z0MUF8_9BACT|nr:PAS domain-containing protein [Hymenobacter wooponensis]
MSTEHLSSSATGPTQPASSLLHNLGMLPEVFAALPGAYLLLTPDLRIAAVSDAYLASTFISRSQLVGHFLLDAFAAEPGTPEAATMSNLRASLQQVVTTGQPQQMPVQHYRIPNPEVPNAVLERYWQSLNTPVFGPDKTVIGFVHSVTDVTASHQAAAHLAGAQAREQAALAVLERERLQLKALLEQAPVAIGLFEGPDLRITAANPLLSAMWGRSQEQVLNRPLLEAVPELQGQGFQEIMQQVSETLVPYVGKEVPAHMLRNGQLMTSYYNFVYQPFFDQQGTVQGVLDVAVEVTEQVLNRQRIEAQEQQTSLLNEELQAANDEILANNVELEYAQHQLRQLNATLEARVLERTHQLANQQLLLQQIIGQVPALVATLRGPDHRYSFFNPYYDTFTAGRVRLGASVAEVLPELVEQGFVKLLDRVYATGEPFVGREIAMLLHNPNMGQDEQYYLDFVYQALLDGQGQTQGILVFAVDTTKQVLARRQTDTLQAAVRRQKEERENVFQLFEQSPAVICLLREPDHRIDYLNPAYQALFPGQQLRGRTLAEVQPEAKALLALFDGIYQTGTMQFQTEVPVTITPPNGQATSTRYFDFTYQAYLEQGGIAGVALFGLDVTEQVLSRSRVQELNEELASINEELRASNEELGDTNEQLSRTNADLDTFVYTASHDLKVPITNIEGLLDALSRDLRGHSTAESVPRILSMMKESVTRFQQTIGHLTDISRLQQESSTEVESLTLAATIADVQLDLAPLLQATGAHITVSITEVPELPLSPKNQRSVMYNLLSNALKYRHPDRVPMIHIHGRRQADGVELQVQDNGLGLEHWQQQRLFGLFQRLHSHVEGAGVGLYMVKKIIENAGGNVRVLSDTNTGSTFTITLPLAPDRSAFISA